MTLKAGSPAISASMHTLKQAFSGSSERSNWGRTAKKPDMGSRASTKILAMAVAIKDAKRL